MANGHENMISDDAVWAGFREDRAHGVVASMRLEHLPILVKACLNMLLALLQWWQWMKRVVTGIRSVMHLQASRSNMWEFWDPDEATATWSMRA